MTGIPQIKCVSMEWMAVHFICFVNSCAFTWVIWDTSPPIQNNYVNPTILFGFLPIITSVLINIYSIKYTRPRSPYILPMYSS